MSHPNTPAVISLLHAKYGLLSTTVFSGRNLAFRINTRHQRRLPRAADLALREKLRLVKLDHLFHIEAVVILTNHQNAIGTFPPKDPDYSGRFIRFKRKGSQRLKDRIPVVVPFLIMAFIRPLKRPLIRFYLFVKLV